MEPTVIKYMSKAQLLEAVPLCYATIWKLMRCDEFPRSYVMAGKVFWREDEVEAWLEERPKQTLKGDDEAVVAEPTSQD